MNTGTPAVPAHVAAAIAKADGEESAYQYCGGDPVGKVDPSGLRKWFLTLAAIQDVRAKLNYIKTATGYIFICVSTPYWTANDSCTVYWTVTVIALHVLDDNPWASRGVRRWKRVNALYEVGVPGSILRARGTKEAAIRIAKSRHIKLVKRKYGHRYRPDLF
ncbi:hypothetical protein MX659_06470 [Coriobacteriia bacterium Es71-Z0120]|uniref:hypothetical protein n=1 Tax=Parvivirga hydrogeniphila TaxID=2939460 RepID=UPI002260B076|nr:hypothetical protein [Parvivirga hydrogeniphila]MCL4079230.1 hypothetical protein [Parvivirga hydrogeniphila]